MKHCCAGYGYGFRCEMLGPYSAFFRVWTLFLSACSGGCLDPKNFRSRPKLSLLIQFSRFPGNPLLIRVPFSYCSALIRGPERKRAEGCYWGTEFCILDPMLVFWTRFVALWTFLVPLRISGVWNLTAALGTSTIQGSGLLRPWTCATGFLTSST